MSAWLINIGGLVAIGFVVWWFWLARPAALRAAGEGAIEVLVADGVYTPARIEVEAGRAVRLRFLRRDPSPCAEQVIFDGLEVAAELPVGSPRELSLTPPKPGEYPFHCQMNMYRGRLIAR
jgi:plastocyanin domain-containing protein